MSGNEIVPEIGGLDGSGMQRQEPLSTPGNANASISLLQTMVSKFSSHKRPGAARQWVAELAKGFQTCQETFGSVFPDRLKVAIAQSRLEGTYRKWSQSLQEEFFDS